MESAVLNFMSPPIPFFIGCGIEPYAAGDRHINRVNTGVFDMITVVKGRLQIGEADREWSLGPSEMLVLRPDLYHYGTTECTEESLIHWIHFQTVGLWAEHLNMDEYLSKQDLLKNQHHVFNIPSFLINSISIPKYMKLPDKALGYIAELTSLVGENRSIAAWKQQSVFQQLLQLLDLEQTIQRDLSAIEVAERTERYLIEHYRSPITNAILQQELNYHPNYIAKCMRLHFGCTAMEYLAEYRLRMAKKLLLNSSRSIEAVAEEVGMNLSNFSNIFKSKEGISPSQFRKKYMRHP